MVQVVACETALLNGDLALALQLFQEAMKILELTADADWIRQRKSSTPVPICARLSGGVFPVSWDSFGALGFMRMMRPGII